MLALGRTDGLTPGELAVQLGVRPPTITKAVNRLRDQGFLDKLDSTTDARQAHIHLTDKGRAALSAIDEAINATETDVFAGFSKKDPSSI